jgi:hypothetical protein
VVGPPGPEITAEFQRYFSSRETAKREELLPYKVVFVPGFNADYLDDTVGYYRKARRELKKLGLKENEDFELLKNQSGFSGEKTMAENAEAMAAYLRNSPKPILAFTHSKGAIDLLETLLRYPELRGKVKGWFSIQGAFGGSILADVLSKGWTRPVVESFLHSYGGSIEALEDLRRPDREVYLRAHLDEIEKLVRELPIISLVTRQEYRRLSSGLKTLVFWFDPDFEEGHSDGMIETRNASLAYTPYIFLEGVDHNDATQQGDFDRARLTHAALKMLLPRIPPK